jgi:hypothetical protein
MKEVTMSDQDQSNGVLGQVVNAINKDKREALKKELRGKITEYRKAQGAADVILDDIVTTLTEAGESADGIAELLKS